MMWSHILMARGFFRRHWMLWTLHVLLVAGLALVCGVFTVSKYRSDSGHAVSAEALSIDVIIRDSAGSEQIAELTTMLNRRPDVQTSVHLRRQDVWRIFQSEIGVQSEGMADIAALPEVVRVHIRSEYVTLQHVNNVARSLRRRLSDRIETVLIPTQAIVEHEYRAKETRSYWTYVAAIGILLVVSSAVVTGWRFRVRSQEAIALRLGRSSAWLRIGPFLMLTIGTVVGVLLASTGAWFHADWLAADNSTDRMLSAMASTGMLTVLVQAFLVIAPASRNRGWK